MKANLIFILTLFLSLNLSAQHGKVDASKVVKSQILGRDMPYSVYLPPSYETSSRPYPVLYLLHGMGDNFTGWTVKGEVATVANNAFKNASAPEMIIVMPDGLSDAFYINNFDKSIRWEDFFYEEFIPEIEKKYRISANVRTRAIAGLSMGGYGSLYHAVKHKDKFGACYAMSAAVLLVEPMKEGDEGSEWQKKFNLKTWGPNNSEGLPENYKKHSVHEMFREMEAIKPQQGGFPFMGGPQLPKICIDCGDDDFLLKQNTELVHIMKSKNVPFEFRVRDGGHTWEYWRTALGLALEFVGDTFRN